MVAASRFSVRVFAATAVTLLVASGAAYLLSARLYLRVTEEAGFESARRAAQMYGEFERSDTEKLTAGLQGLLSDDGLQRAFVARDREALLSLAAPVMDRLRLSGITHWYFITPERQVFLRAHEPPKHGDVVDRVTVMRAAATGVAAAGKELGLTAFALRVVSPWRDAQGRLIGFMELGEEIDHFLTRMKQGTGDDFGLLVKKEFLDEKSWVDVLDGARNTWNDRPDEVLVDTTSFAQGIADFRGNIDDIPNDGLMLETRVDDDGAWIRGAFPVRDASGRRVGALFILHDFGAPHGAFVAGRSRGLFVVIGITVLGLLALWGLVRAGARSAASEVPSSAAGPAAERSGGDDGDDGSTMDEQQGRAARHRMN